jgi:hypothetical protein
MEFINTQPKRHVYAGSMQLMAGVKACTQRRITNHPHFEDQYIRSRTLRLYKMYGRFSPEEVHQMLKEEKATHIIVENSICYTKSTGCALKDVIDDAYGMKTESGLKPFPSSRDFPHKAVDRFCESIKQSPLFNLLFQNRTFRLYEIVFSSQTS